MDDWKSPRYDLDERWMRPLPPAESPNEPDRSEQVNNWNPVEPFNLDVESRDAVGRGLVWDAEETMFRGLIVSVGALVLSQLFVQIELPYKLAAAVGALFIFLFASLTVGLYRGAYLETDIQVRLNPHGGTKGWVLLVMYMIFRNGLADAFKHSSQAKGQWLPSAGVALLGAIKTTWWIVAFVTVVFLIEQI